MADATNATATAADDPERTRFLQELEFVCCLANPKYIAHLAQELYLEDPAFINYLDYLQYWRQAEYASFVVYPHALHFLELLQHESFRKALKDPAVAEQIHCQQFYHWENRARLVKPEANANGAAAAPAKSPYVAAEAGGLDTGRRPGSTAQPGDDTSVPSTDMPRAFAASTIKSTLPQSY